MEDPSMKSRRISRKKGTAHGDSSSGPNNNNNTSLKVFISLITGFVIIVVFCFNDGNHIHKKKVYNDDYPYYGSGELHTASYVPGGMHRYLEWKDGDTPYNITDDVQDHSDWLARKRRAYVKKAMEHAWTGYRACAFGMDEVAPATCVGKDIAMYGISTTLVDSLDTLWLMGMKDEFNEARDWIVDNLKHDSDKSVSTFENTIRSLGGLLAAYDWSGDKMLLEKAKDVGDRLVKAFDSPSGIPWSFINLKTGKGSNSHWNPGGTSVAEAGTLQIEFRFLAKATGIPKYAEKAEKAFDMLYELRTEDGLYHTEVKNNVSPSDIGRGISHSSITFGGSADSFYEYMLKLWLQGGKTEQKYRDMYDEAIEGMHNKLLQKSNSPAKLSYIAKLNGNRYVHSFGHLECFMGGLLALGAYNDPLGADSERAQRDMKTAKALTYTCYQMCAANPTGLGLEDAQGFDRELKVSPEENLIERRRKVFKKLRGVTNNGDKYTNADESEYRKNHALSSNHTDARKDMYDKEDEFHDFHKGGGKFYMLRPEVVESFYILNKITGDPIYREWGWEIFQSIEKYCRHPFGYGHYPDVTNAHLQAENNMESFFLGETLKYLYLLFDPDSEVDIDKHVFNTEAHPLRMFDVLDELTKSKEGGEDTDKKTD